MNVTTSSSVKIIYAEVDLSNFIDGARRCKSVIGPFQWAMIMGRIDATTAMMIPSVFLVVHQLDYVTSVVVSFYQLNFVEIRFEEFREPDCYNLMVLHRDWAHNAINDGACMRTRDDTVLLVTLVAITPYVNACLPHDPPTGHGEIQHHRYPAFIVRIGYGLQPSIFR
jgi:hypothetical protein